MATPAVLYHHHHQRTFSTHSNNSSNNNNSNSLNVSDEINALIQNAATTPQTSVSLQALMMTGRGLYLHKTFEKEKMHSHAATELVLQQVASFLRRELPIRMAHRVADLENISVLRDMSSVQEVRRAYIQSFQEIMEFSPKIDSTEKEVAFAKLIERIYERHGNVLVQMARGAYQFRQQVRLENVNYELEEETHLFLDRFYLCRIGIRVLIGQYLALRQPPVENYVGIVCDQTSPYEVVKRAIDDAAFMCTRKYGDAPDVIMNGRLDLTFPYVPTHLHYIMLELIKNSMRATVEWHGIDAEYPDIKVIIADGKDNEDVVIKVSDEGGGIPRSNVNKIWSYLFTTADPSIQEGLIGQGNDHGTDSPLAGLGYGLPISRSYCRYFGGDLSIMSMEGFGTDAFTYLTRLGNTKEPLPI